MNERVKILTSEAAKLPRDEQIELVDGILSNLPADPEWDRTWAAEAERRLSAVRHGEMKTYDAGEVFADARERLARSRGKRVP